MDLQTFHDHYAIHLYANSKLMYTQTLGWYHMAVRSVDIVSLRHDKHICNTTKLKQLKLACLR